MLLLVILAALAFRMTSPEDRQRYLGIALAFVRELRVAAAESEPEREYRDALRARTGRLLVTPVLVAINVMVVAGILFSAGAIGDPDTLLAWGGSLGPRTTNGEWWRLVTSTFVHAGTLHLLVNVAVLIQVGVVLERLAGRLAFAGVYVAGSVFAGLVNLSSHPLVATSGASAAIFGLYGLLLASVFWQLFQRRAEEPSSDEGDGEGENDDAASTAVMPLRWMKRIGAGAAIFFLYSALNGFVHTAEWAALLAGVMSGLVLGRGVGGEEPKTSRAAAVMAVAAAIAIAFAVPLRGIADVKPEIVNVFATEERTVAVYRDASDAFARGRLTADALAQLAERTILFELQAADARLAALKNVPPEQQALVADARAYLRLRGESWQARAAAIRKTNPDLRKAPSPAADTHSRLQAEARFRSNQVALGNAEGAERAALEAFQRIKGAAPL
jgi:membrane associated rhomboid family serine protease